MKRIACAALLAFGLSGCITIYQQPPQQNTPSVAYSPLSNGSAEEAQSAQLFGVAASGNGGAATPPYVPAGPSPYASSTSTIPANPQPCVGVCYGVRSSVTGLPRNTYVRGYTRRDGTYVRPHTRSRRR